MDVHNSASSRILSSSGARHSQMALFCLFKNLTIDILNAITDLIHVKAPSWKLVSGFQFQGSQHQPSRDVSPSLCCFPCLTIMPMRFILSEKEQYINIHQFTFRYFELGGGQHHSDLLKDENKGIIVLPKIILCLCCNR